MRDFGVGISPDVPGKRMERAYGGRFAGVSDPRFNAIRNSWTSEGSPNWLSLYRLNECYIKGFAALRGITATCTPSLFDVKAERRVR